MGRGRAGGSWQSECSGLNVKAVEVDVACAEEVESGRMEQTSGSRRRCVVSLWEEILKLGPTHHCFYCVFVLSLLVCFWLKKMSQTLTEKLPWICVHAVISAGTSFLPLCDVFSGTLESWPHSLDSLFNIPCLFTDLSSNLEDNVSMFSLLQFPAAVQ